MLGVCARLADILVVDVLIIRIIFLLFLMSSGGTAIIVYLILSLLL